MDGFVAVKSVPVKPLERFLGINLKPVCASAPADALSDILLAGRSPMRNNVLVLTGHDRVTPRAIILPVPGSFTLNTIERDPVTR